MKDYRQIAKDYIENYMDIQDDIVTSEYTDLDGVAEHLINTIDVDFWPGQSDEEWEAEADRQRIEIYNVLLTEYADACYKGELMRQILDIFYEDAELMEFYNDNIWDVYGDLNELFDNVEDLERINKNLGGKEVKKIC